MKAILPWGELFRKNAENLNTYADIPEWYSNFIKTANRCRDPVLWKQQYGLYKKLIRKEDD